MSIAPRKSGRFFVNKKPPKTGALNSTSNNYLDFDFDSDIFSTESAM